MLTIVNDIFKYVINIKIVFYYINKSITSNQIKLVHTRAMKYFLLLLKSSHIYQKGQLVTHMYIESIKVIKYGRWQNQNIT